ncbi:MAG: STAS domain-containing protein [Bacteroidota bacterium]
MKYNLDKQEKYSILSLEEEKLDSMISPDIKSVFHNVQAEGSKNIIVDLSKVKYSDSSGLSALLVGNRIFTDQQGAFVLAAVSDHVMKLIKISMLDKVLDIIPTVAESVDAILLHEVEAELNRQNEEE